MFVEGGEGRWMEVRGGEQEMAGSQENLMIPVFMNGFSTNSYGNIYLCSQFRRIFDMIR